MKRKGAFTLLHQIEKLPAVERKVNGILPSFAIQEQLKVSACPALTGLVRGYFLASDSGKLRWDDQKKFIFGHFFVPFVHFLFFLVIFCFFLTNKTPFSPASQMGSGLNGTPSWQKQNPRKSA